MTGKIESWELAGSFRCFRPNSEDKRKVSKKLPEAETPVKGAQLSIETNPPQEQANSEVEGSAPLEWIGLEERPVKNIEEFTPTEILYLNFANAKQFIEDAGVEALLIRGLDKLRLVFGVRKSNKQEIINAIREYKGMHAPFVRRVSPRPSMSESGFIAGSTKKTPTIDRADVIRLSWHFRNSQHENPSGEEFGCEIEFWDDIKSPTSRHLFDDEIIAPRHNSIARRIRDDGKRVSAPLSKFTRLAPKSFDGIMVSTYPEMAMTLPTDITFPIDLVYTWVDGNDSVWQDLKKEHDPSLSVEDVHEESASEARYIDRNELMYSLRSAWAYAPWVNHIYIVTADQHPTWLKFDDPRISVVSHSEIFENPDDLPTFNSHSIESKLHRISGLSEHFLYLNDDMFFGRPVIPEQFFHGNGICKHFVSPSRVPFFEKTSMDTPVDQATKNSRELLNRKFGVSQSQVFEHAPYALRKSILEDIQQSFPEEHARTAASKFRSSIDLNIPSHMAHHYGYLKGCSIPGSILFTYLGLSIPDLPARFKRLLHRRDRDAFCLNDTFTTPEELELQTERVVLFLEAYYPTHAPWESDLKEDA